MTSNRSQVGAQDAELATVLDSLREAVFTLGIDGRFRRASAAATRLFGIPRDAWEGMPLTDLPMASETARQLDDLHARAVEQEDLAESELTMRHLSGRPFPAETTMVLRRDADGRESGQVLVVRDISHRKNNEAQVLRRTRQLSILHEVGSLVNRQLDLNTVLSSALERLRQLVHCDVAAFFINAAGQEGVMLRLQEGSGVAQELLERERRRERSTGPEWRAAHRREVVLHENVQDSSTAATGLLADARVRAAAYLPIETRGRLFGILALGRQDNAPFSSEDLDLFLPLGQLLATAVENAQLVDGLRRLNEQLVALHELSARLASNVSEAHAERETLSSLAHSLGGRAVLLFMPDASGQHLRLRSSVGLPASLRQDLSVSLEIPLDDDPDDPAARAFLSHQMVEHTGFGSPPGVEGWKYLTDVIPLKSLVAAPVRHRDEALGAVCVGFTVYRALDDDERRLVHMALRSAGAFISNARLFSDLEKHRHSLAHLSSQILTAQEEERRHLSRELHDGIGQSLSALKLGIEMMARDKNSLSDSIREDLQRTLGIASDTIAELRRISHDLRPSILDDLGLIPTLRWFARRFTEQTGAEVSVEVRGDGRGIAPRQDVNLYRIVQEGLNNAVTHGKARRIRVAIDIDTSMLKMVITDDGCGFDASAVPSAESPGLGLASIKERINLMGGRFRTKTRPGAGTSLIIEVPSTDTTPTRPGS
ncbi:MAG: GAF domain-containing protein [Acidobacteriota bacterium]